VAALLADAVLLLHAAVVLFVVGGLVLVVLGNTAFTWPWVNRRWFRCLHGLAIGTVVAQAWLGITCPLTTLEAWLRTQAGQPAYGSEGFIAHWLQRLIFYEAPGWVFALAYTAFFGAVAAAWWRWPPIRPMQPVRPGTHS
jgi:polyferredoxin